MTRTDSDKETPSIEQDELRGISRSVGEIEWLLLIVVLLYHAFGGVADQIKAYIKLGYTFIAAGVDVDLLQSGAAQLVKAVREV